MTDMESFVNANFEEICDTERMDDHIEWEKGLSYLRGYQEACKYYDDKETPSIK